MKGSGLFTAYRPRKPHLLVGPGGVAHEIEKLYQAIQTSLGGLAGMVVEEWDAPPAASATAVQAATASVNGPVTYTSISGALSNAAFALAARNLTFTGGGTTGQCPTSALITGFDAGGNAQTETVALTAGAGTGVKGWSKVTSIAFTGGTGTAGTVSVGTGNVIGLSYAPQLRAGLTSPIAPYFPELEDGAAAGTAGAIDTVHHTYTPHDHPNGSHKWALYYDAVLT